MREKHPKGGKAQRPKGHSARTMAGNMIRPTIGIGYRCGDLVVAAETLERKSGYKVWKCQCSCGGHIDLDTRTLQRKTVTDCGCRSRVKPGVRDLTGERFGRLVCIEATNQRDSGGSAMWRCRCDCGKECIASAKQLRSGYKKSCGCLGHPPLKDFVGKRFGQLTVLAYAGKKRGMHYWRCQCDCGGVTEVGQSLLQSGKTKSCGCLQTVSYLKNIGIVDGTSVSVLEYFKNNLLPNNTSGYTGVYLDTRRGKWIAQMGFKGKRYTLGSFDNKMDAVAARKEGEEMRDRFLELFYSDNPQWKRKDASAPAKEAETKLTSREAGRFLDALRDAARSKAADGRLTAGYSAFSARGSASAE